MASGVVESGAWVCWVVGDDTAKRRDGETARDFESRSVIRVSQCEAHRARRCMYFIDDLY
jgi:hypothetical protein